MEPADREGIELVFHPSLRAATAPTLLILLPGLNIRAEDFLTQGFVAALHEGADAVDLVIAEPDLDFYLDGSIARRLRQVIAAQDSQRYCQIWLGGISLGCFGALLATSESADAIDGLVLLSPFLGAPGLIAEVERAGGLSTWQPGAIADNDGERRVLAWLKSYIRAERQGPLMHLGYGHSDRFAAGSRLLGAGLPLGHVHVTAGGHDWPTWAKLWRQILNARPFSPP